MNVRWVRYSYSKPGESNLEITCAGEVGGTGNDSTWWFMKLFGLYFLLLLVPLLYLSLTWKVNALPSEAVPRLSPGGELEVRSLIAEGKKIEAIKRVRELTRVNLEAAKDCVEAYRGHQ